MKDPEDRFELDPVVEELIRLRQERGWSATDLAVQALIARGTVYMIEKGERRAMLHTIQALALALGYRVALVPLDLQGGEG